MKIIEKYLTEKELEPVADLLGEQVYMIFSPGLNVNLKIIEADSYSLSLKKGFFNFFTSWIDSDEYDYYEINLSKSEYPFGIKRNDDGLLLKTSSISITPVSKIKRIELFEDKADYELNGPTHEIITVKYDSAFLFSQKDGKKFLIGVSETIADLTLFLRDEQAIIEHLAKMEKRKEWK